MAAKGKLQFQKSAIALESKTGLYTLLLSSRKHMQQDMHSEYSNHWEGHVHSAICKMDNQQKPIVYHMELCSMLCASLDGRGVWGRMDACICMPESLRYSPETTTTLLTGYTPIQNKNFKVKTTTNNKTNLFTKQTHRE